MMLLIVNWCMSWINLLHFFYLKISTDKWMTIPDMGYVIANRYNVIVVCLSLKQSLTIFPLRSQPPTDFNHHRIICIEHVHGNHFVQFVELHS